MYFLVESDAKKKTKKAEIDLSRKWSNEIKSAAQNHIRLLSFD